MQQVHTLLSAAAATGAGNALKIGGVKKNIPITISGTFVGTVQIQGTNATDQEVRENTATFVELDGGEVTEALGVTLIAPFTHIRANVTAYTSGSITVKAAL